MSADVEFDTAVLRQPAFGDIEVGHDLDSRRDGKGQVPRRRDHFVQDAVGLDADPEFVLERLEVQVAGVVLDRQQQDHVEQFADRGAVGQGLDAGEVDRPVAVELGCRCCQVGIGLEVGYQTLDAFGIARIKPVEDRLDFSLGRDERRGCRSRGTCGARLGWPVFADRTWPR